MAEFIMFNSNDTKGINQGLKILGYGEDGSGKSVFGLSFPDSAIIDSESKLGVYLKNPKYNKNIKAYACLTNYYDSLDLLNKVINNTKLFKTFITDSETNVYEGMQVSSMEVEEDRARKKGGNIDDQVVSMRGYGKIKLNNSRLKNAKAHASSKGVTIISIAQKDDIFQEVNGKQIKIGEKPALRKGCKHDYDIVLRFYKEKDIATGEFKYFAEVEKDTTETYPVGKKIEKVSYENWKDYIENNRRGDMVEADYDKAIDLNIENMKQEAEDFDTISKEFVELFQKLTKKDVKNKEAITKLLKDNNIESYKNPETFEELKKVVSILKTM